MRIGVLEQAGGDRGWFFLDGDRARRFDGSPFEGARLGSIDVAWSPADLRAPVRPSKIVCVGRNYTAHAKEMGAEVPKEPLLFLKAPSSIVGPGGAVVLPKESERVEHEAELGVVIGRRTRRASREDASRAIYGYPCVCDVTARPSTKSRMRWFTLTGSRPLSMWPPCSNVTSLAPGTGSRARPAAASPRPASCSTKKRR